MADQTYNDGTLSTALSQDGNSALPDEREKARAQKESGKGLPSDGGEDEGSSSSEGSDDHLEDDQKPLRQ